MSHTFNLDSSAVIKREQFISGSSQHTGTKDNSCFDIQLLNYDDIITVLRAIFAFLLFLLHSFLQITQLKPFTHIKTCLKTVIFVNNGLWTNHNNPSVYRP